MSQNILSLQTQDQLIHRLKLKPTDSPYFIGQSSQAHLGQECLDFEEFEGAFVYSAGNWNYVSFSNKNMDSSSIVEPLKIKKSKVFIDNYTSKGYESKKILTLLDGMSKLSLNSDSKLVLVHLDPQMNFKKISQFNNVVDASKIYPLCLKGSSNLLNQWQRFETKTEVIYFKQIFIDTKKFEHFFKSSSSLSNGMLVGIAAFVLSAIAGLQTINFKNDVLTDLPKKELVQITTMKLQKNHPKTAPSRQTSQTAASTVSVANSAPSHSETSQSQKLSSLTNSMSRLSRLSNVSVSKNATLSTARNVASVQKNLGVGSNFTGAIGTSPGNSTQYFKNGTGSGSSTGRSIAGLIGDGGGLVDLLDKETKASEGLDKEEIAKVIKKNLGQVLYCYERQLSANSQLFGKMTVQFQIDGAGKVEFQKVAESSLNDKQMEACVLGKISKFMFPQPKDGMKVLVNYPFLFKSIQ